LLKQIERFPDLRAGGRELALQLEAYRGDCDLVLGLAMGGLPVAHEVATHLGLPLDFVIIRRLLMPQGYGSQACVVSVAGSPVIDERIKPVDQPSTPLEYFLAEALAAFSLREKTCRRARPPVAVTGRDVILVDCGIRTGSTMTAALEALRKLEPKRIVGAVPVASPEGFAVIAPLCDELVCLAQPENFINAGYWYRDFTRPGDNDVGDLLQ
jgi:predicted phosphoribosyltransferase